VRTSECDIVIVGVGGQGVIFISEVLGQAAVRMGKHVRGAETHGMAQRGGSVINYTRIGCRFGPMVPSGGADVLLALEPAEALRFCHYISRDGIALVNTQPVLPITVTTGRACYPSVDGILKYFHGICREVWSMDATAIAKTAGTAQAANAVMLGALSKYIPIPASLLLETLCDVVPKRHLDVNKRAFSLGKAEVE
jgi:indolepyruvate ferredoxin oxidoreductase beta subunit